jgi:hypothetical protein
MLINSPAGAPAKSRFIPNEALAPRPPVASRAGAGLHQHRATDVGRIAERRHRHADDAERDAREHSRQQRIHGPRLYMIRRAWCKPTCSLPPAGVCSENSRLIWQAAAAVRPTTRGAGKVCHVISQWRPLAREPFTQGPHSSPPQDTAVAHFSDQASRSGQAREIRGVSHSSLGHHLSRGQFDRGCVFKAHAGLGHAAQGGSVGGDPRPHQQ